MHRVASIKPAGTWDTPSAREHVVLDADDRRRRRIVLTGAAGTRFLLDLSNPVTLRDGDGLLLDDGTIVRVAGLPEPLAELGARSPREFVCLAWHLGNRHTDVQIDGVRIRIRRDHVLEDMAAALGASTRMVDAPFDPEGEPVHAE